MSFSEKLKLKKGKPWKSYLDQWKAIHEETQQWNAPKPSLLSGPRKHRYGKNPAVPVPGTSWVRILPGYRCMRTPGVPLFRQKKNFQYGFGTGQIRSGSGPVRGGLKLSQKCEGSIRLTTSVTRSAWYWWV